MRAISRIMAGLAVAACGAPGAAAATPAAGIEEILVVGARLPRPVQDVVGTVDVITRDALLDALALAAEDVVRYTPGVSVARADNRFGATEFTIRGLSGNRVTTLVDGVPTADQFDIGAFANAGQDYLVADAVSRIEILRGPASTLFGSDALGGVVAVVTREPEEYLQGRRVATSASATYSGADGSRALSGGVAGRSGALSAVLHGSVLAAESLDAAGTDDEDEADRRRSAAMFTLVRHLGDGSAWRLKGQAFEEKVESRLASVLGYGRQFANTTSLMGDDERRRFSVQLEHDFPVTGGWADHGRWILYGQRNRVRQDTDEGRAPALEIHRAFDYRFDDAGLVVDLESRFDSGRLAHRLGWGGTVRRSWVEEYRDGRQVDLATGESSRVLLGEVMPVRDFPNSRVTEAALYLHDEIELGRLTLIPGVRLEWYRLDAQADARFREDNPNARVEDVTESALAPKLAAQWQLGERAEVFAQYARGFRAPPFEDVNVGLDIPMFNIRAIANPDLEAETSDGLELGVRYRSGSWRGTFTLFGADYDDFIESRVNLGPDPDTGVLLFQSRNIERARVYGAEAGLAGPLAENLDLDVAASWTRGEDRESGEPLNTVDPPALVTRLQWQAGARWETSLAVRAAAKQTRTVDAQPEPFEPEGYVVLDLTARYTPRPHVRINLGLFNLTDQTYWRWAAVRGRPQGDPLIDLLAAPGRYGAVAVHVRL